MRTPKEYNELNLDLISKKDVNGLIKLNMPYILKLAENFKESDYKEDLIQIGRETLWKCMVSYNEDKNPGFMNYAGKRIKWEMIRYISEYSHIIRIPSNRIPDMLDGTLTMPNVNSLDSKVMNGTIHDSSTIHPTQVKDLIPEIIEEQPDYTDLFKNINKLKTNQQYVIKHKFGIGVEKKSRTQMAEELNLSVTRISAILDASLTKLRKLLHHS